MGDDDQEKKDRIVHVKKMIDSPLRDIQWADEQTLFVITEKGNLYQSSDRGRSWHSQGKNLVGATATPSSASAVIEGMYVSPADPSNIFFMGKHHDNWFTTDMGKTYQHSPLGLSDIRMHPNKAGWILGAGLSEGCKAKTRDSANACYKSLYYSKDLGLHWTRAVDYIVQFDWAPTIGKKDKAGRYVSDDLIYATYYSEKVGDQKFGFWDKRIDFVATSDYFKYTKVLVKHGNRFIFGDHNYLFVAQVNPVREEEVFLQVSRDNVTHLHFERARLPVVLREHSYTILDTSEGSVFLHVNHQPFQEGAYAGHVYVSDWSGLLYTLSLPYNARSADGKCDFEKVEGIEGIYLANFIDEDDMDQWEAQERKRGRSPDKNTRKNRLRTKTVITLDKGAKWDFLTAPKVDSQGKSIECTGCSLHLHGITDQFGPFYTSKSATGLVIATGVVGHYLEEKPDQINTYLSRDAGLSWMEVAKGSHIYEFGDHGGLIVMARDSISTTEILYSWNEGLSWSTYKISEEPLQVENIIIEKNALSQQFTVYGWQGEVGVMVFLDFSELHERPCIGHEAPDTEKSDYETWSPSDGRPDSKCLLGHTVSYTRRKRDRECFNPEEFERGVELEHCQCTEADFECDYGFQRKTTKAGEPYGECEPLANQPAHQDFSGYIYQTCGRQTKGYRRVPGDTCIGGQQWDAVEKPCSSTSTGFGTTILAILFLIAIVWVVVTASTKYDWFDSWMQRMKSWFSYQHVDRQIEVDTVEEDDGYFNDGVDAPPKEIGNALENGLNNNENQSTTSTRNKKHDPKKSQSQSKDNGANVGPLPRPKSSSAPVPKLQPPPTASV